MADQQFDIVVLGGGSAGYATALRAKQLGYSVALIEKEKLGGTCLHRGCVPTKALLHSAEIADVAREGAKYGVTSSVEGIDIAGVLGFKDNLVAGKFKGLQGLIKANGISVIEGEGRLVAPNTVRVGANDIIGTNIVLATGRTRVHCPASKSAAVSLPASTRSSCKKCRSASPFSAVA